MGGHGLLLRISMLCVRVSADERIYKILEDSIFQKKFYLSLSLENLGNFE